MYDLCGRFYNLAKDSVCVCVCIREKWFFTSIPRMSSGKAKNRDNKIKANATKIPKIVISLFRRRIIHTHRAEQIYRERNGSYKCLWFTRHHKNKTAWFENSVAKSHSEMQNVRKTFHLFSKTFSSSLENVYCVFFFFSSVLSPVFFSLCVTVVVVVVTWLFSGACTILTAFTKSRLFELSPELSSCYLNTNWIKRTVD